MKLHLAVLAVATVLLAPSLALHADSITLHLGQSNENYTLTGTGGSGGYGTYLATPGACSAGASVTTCQLTGTYTSSATGYTSGTYTLTTTFENADGGLPAISVQPINSASGGNYFTLLPYTSDVNVTLALDDISGDKSLALVASGVTLGGSSTYITATNSICSGVPIGTPCTQGNVGLSVGGSVTSPVTTDVIYNFPSAHAPEPEWLALGGMLPGVFVAIRRRTKRSA